jgi:hypothetical protein
MADIFRRPFADVAEETAIAGFSHADFPASLFSAKD